MKYSNYFDIESEKLTKKDIASYLVNLYRKMNAPKGALYSWKILPHEEQGIDRVYAVYKIESIDMI